MNMDTKEFSFKFHEFFNPILDFLTKNQSATGDVIKQYLINLFKLSQEQLEIYLPSGAQTVFTNRFSWAFAYLDSFTGLITKISKNKNKNINLHTYALTEKGQQFLIDHKNQANFTPKDLRPYFIKNEKSNILDPNDPKIDFIEETPDKQIEDIYKEIIEKLKSDLLETLTEMNPFEFERIIGLFFEHLGYGKAQTTQKTRDGGFDVIINKDKLGLEQIYIQVKRYQKENTIGAPVIQQFLGALSQQSGISNGIFVTTSHFTKDALSSLNTARDKVILIDGDKLVDLMIDNKFGVEETINYPLFRINRDYLQLNEND